MMILKEFSRIVCVSLFSYQGSLSFDSSFILSLSFSFVKNFFKFFQNFLMAFVIRCLSATRLLYHIHFWMSSTFLKFFIFSKIQKLQAEKEGFEPSRRY